ncbi:hypothetical protein HL653_17690 [Sphingomonas sp. AP4-R1]|uniref:DUF6961 family protein n=1 Tax=Sphingomonas sp. AP4-R1 TaxID=2735134 RepID=UPI001493B8F4|nr:hypothetical protein [Sphingomonas sp. AP4-R1]QJU59347.1 hypothetical protein HL653_17690 [Sphingomonas sp. AP4-R1]
MISDRELWACAAEIVRQYGAHAIDHASSRAADLARAGDEGGVRAWVSIADRIGQLTDLPGEGDRPN